MQVAVVLAALLAPIVAHADAKADVDALIVKNVAAIAKNSRTKFDETLRRDAYVFWPSTEAPSLVERFDGYHAYDAKNTIEKTVIVVDDKAGTAWFHVQFHATFGVAMLAADGNPGKGDERLRMVGFALNDKGWKIAAVMYGHAIPDKTLFERKDPDAKAEKQRVNGVAADVVAHWFDGKGKIAADRAAGSIVVNGTDDNEYAVDAAAAGASSRSRSSRRRSACR